MTTENDHVQGSASDALSNEDKARREFLKSAGRFAVLTPPAVTLLLSTSMNSHAIASSGGKPTTYPSKPTGPSGKPGGGPHK